MARIRGPITRREDTSGVAHVTEAGTIISLQEALWNSGTGESSYRWDDLRTPSVTVNPPGLASDPDRDTSDGTLLFDAASTEIVFFGIQMPHAWAEGTEIHPHIHWAKTTSAAGNVVWKLEYKHAPINAVMDSAFTSLGEKDTPEFTEQDTADWHQITSLGYMTMTGYDDSHCMLFKLSRVGGSASDTYGADAKMISFDIHYQINSRGSVEEYPGVS